MTHQMCVCVYLKKTKNAELRTVGTWTSQFRDQGGRLRRFGHVERKDDTDWIKRCAMMEVERTKSKGRDGWEKHAGMVSRMIWKDLICPGRMHDLGENGEGKLRGHPANPSSAGRRLLNRDCGCYIHHSIIDKRKARVSLPSNRVTHCHLAVFDFRFQTFLLHQLSTDSPSPLHVLRADPGLRKNLHSFSLLYNFISPKIR